MLLPFIRPYTASLQINAASLILRLSCGFLMMAHGYNKLISFSDMAPGFMNFLGFGREISLVLAVFAEFFCSILVILGFATRFALFPLIITMLVAIFIAHGDDPFHVKEHALLFLFPYLSLLILGAGKYSLDYLIFGKKSG